MQNLATSSRLTNVNLAVSPRNHGSSTAAPERNARVSVEDHLDQDPRQYTLGGSAQQRTTFPRVQHVLLGLN